jgi:hypothetical protein
MKQHCSCRKNRGRWRKAREDKEEMVRKHSPGPKKKALYRFLPRPKLPQMHYDLVWGQSEPGGPEKLLLLQSLAMSCIGLIND